MHTVNCNCYHCVLSVLKGFYVMMSGVEVLGKARGRSTCESHLRQKNSIVAEKSETKGTASTE